MKRCLIVVIALAACSKSNDVSTLHHEAVGVANYYQPQLDQLDKRVQSIFKRGTTIPANLPGIEEVGKRLTEARDTIVQLRGIVGKGPDGKSAVEKQADLAAKDRKVEDLEKLIEDTETTLEHGTTVVNDDLYSVESWIALYDQGLNRAGGAQPAQPGQPQPQQPVPAQQQPNDVTPPPPPGSAPGNTPATPSTPPPATEHGAGSAAPHH